MWLLIDFPKCKWDAKASIHLWKFFLFLFFFLLFCFFFSFWRLGDIPSTPPGFEPRLRERTVNIFTRWPTYGDLHLWQVWMCRNVDICTTTKAGYRDGQKPSLKIPRQSQNHLVTVIKTVAFTKPVAVTNLL